MIDSEFVVGQMEDSQISNHLKLLLYRSNTVIRKIKLFEQNEIIQSFQYFYSIKLQIKDLQIPKRT